jgi:hypothetical protein
MFIVKAKLAFPEKKDAERCMLALRNTVFQGCATTHYKVVEEDDEHSDRGTDD